MSRRFTGYIVVSPSGAHSLGPTNDDFDRTSPGGILWITLGGPAKVFETRGAAESALRRTKKYRDSKFPALWKWFDQANIQRVEWGS